MPLIAYVEREFSQRSLALIAAANRIIGDYTAQGYNLTLRQLYYQFVARDLLPNRPNEYKRLGNVVNDGRLAGLIDWDAIEDRTRNLQSLSTWWGPSDIVAGAAAQFRLDLWYDQAYRIEVWIEKEALAGVFQRVCESERVPFFSCRGYTSQSEMWGAAQRLNQYQEKGQTPAILHFGDHDPSGIDMSRDIKDRLGVFQCNVIFRRLALNMDQVEAFSPPPNPAKVTDSRFDGYLREYGAESWELDALEPAVLAGLVSEAVAEFRDNGMWADASDLEDENRKVLREASNRWPDVVQFLGKRGAP